MHPLAFTRYVKNIVEHRYSDDACFACGCPLTAEIRTEEHVIPGWMQHRFDLWNRTISLLNETPLPYRQLKIPCCFRCNNNILSPLEKRVERALDAGFAQVASLDRLDIYRWLAKVFLGLQYKELGLLMDRSDRSKGTILDSAFLQRCRILHHWIQVEHLVDGVENFPGSVWVMRAQVPSDVLHQFDLRDDAVHGVITIRAGDVILAADLWDHAVHREVSFITQLEQTGIALHPQQFVETTAVLAYGARLIPQRGRAQFVNLPQVEDRAALVCQWHSTAIEGFMRSFDAAEFAEILAYFMGAPLGVVYQPPNRLLTCLRSPSGDFVEWKLGDNFPFPAVKILVDEQNRPVSSVPYHGTDDTRQPT